MVQQTKEHWFFASPAFMTVTSLMVAGNIAYPDHMPKWYKTALPIVLLYFIASLVYMVSRWSQRRANGLMVPGRVKDSTQTTAGLCILMTAIAFVTVASLTEDHVSVPLIKLYLLAIFVSTVLFIIGGRSTVSQNPEEKLRLL